MTRWPHRLTRLDRLFGPFTKLRPGEGRSVITFFFYALLIMLSYYVLKTIREPLLLTKASAEMKSYAYAATAFLLLVIVPLYGLVFRHTGKRQLTRYVTTFFLACLLIFYLMGRSGIDIGFAYYVWVGIFSVMITAQFWAFAADSYNVKSGQRLFPVIMVGSTLGGLIAPGLAGALFPVLGPWKLMIIAMVLLALTLPFVGWSRASVPPGSRSHYAPGKVSDRGGLLGGIGLVLTDRYLFLLAMMIVLLNWVNTTGEYILAELVVRHANGLVLSQAGFDKGAFIAAFYGNFYLVVNALTLLIQLTLVARIIHWIGVRGAVLILPLIAMLGYGLVLATWGLGMLVEPSGPAVGLGAGRARPPDLHGLGDAGTGEDQEVEQGLVALVGEGMCLVGCSEQPRDQCRIHLLAGCPGLARCSQAGGDPLEHRRDDVVLQDGGPTLDVLAPGQQHPERRQRRQLVRDRGARGSMWLRDRVREHICQRDLARPALRGGHVHEEAIDPGAWICLAQSLHGGGPHQRVVQDHASQLPADVRPLPPVSADALHVRWHRDRSLHAGCQSAPNLFEARRAQLFHGLVQGQPQLLVPIPQLLGGQGEGRGGQPLRVPLHVRRDHPVRGHHRAALTSQPLEKLRDAGRVPPTGGRTEPGHVPAPLAVGATQQGIDSSGVLARQLGITVGEDLDPGSESGWGTLAAQQGE